MISIIKNVYLYNDIEKMYHIIIKDSSILDILSSDDDFTQFIDQASYIEDAQEYIAFPGMIDVHTHMRDFELSYKEDYFTGSKACLHGGVTVFFDMPNTIPPTLCLQKYEDKLQRAKEKSLVDFGFHFGTSNQDNCNEILSIQKKYNISALKIYLNETTGNLYIHDDILLEKIFQSAPSRIMVHAEGTDLIQKVFNLAKQYNKNIYFCHIALKEEIKLLSLLKKEIESKEYQFNIFIEATIHHLHFNQSFMNSSLKEKILQMKPTLKSSQDQEAMMEALKNGIIDTIGTDHAPHLLSEKLEQVYFGVPGVEHALPFLLDLAFKKEVTYQDIVRLYSSNPATFFNIMNKGFLKKGYDADIVLISPTEETVLNSENIQSKCSFSLFDNQPLKGKVKQTWVRGQKCYDNNQNNYYNEKHQGKEVSINGK